MSVASIVLTALYNLIACLQVIILSIYIRFLLLKAIFCPKKFRKSKVVICSSVEMAAVLVNNDVGSHFLRCWSSNSMERPSMSEVVRIMTHLASVSVDTLSYTDDTIRHGVKYTCICI